MASAILPVALALVPIGAFWAARRFCSRRTATILGLAFGVVVSPLAAGLYVFYFVSPWGVVPGLLGLVLEFIHGPPGFWLAHALHLIPSGVVSGLRSTLTIEALNGVIWGLFYGLVGAMIDRYRHGSTRSLAS